MNILSIGDEIDKFFKELEKIINSNFSNPIMWIIILVVILSLLALVMNILGNKK